MPMGFHRIGYWEVSQITEHIACIERLPGSGLAINSSISSPPLILASNWLIVFIDKHVGEVSNPHSRNILLVL